MEERRNEDIITTFLVIAKNWKHPQCQPTGVCLNEYAYIHTSEYCSAGLYGLGGAAAWARDGDYFVLGQVALLADLSSPIRN